MSDSSARGSVPVKGKPTDFFPRVSGHCQQSNVLADRCYTARRDCPPKQRLGFLQQLGSSLRHGEVRDDVWETPFIGRIGWERCPDRSRQRYERITRRWQQVQVVRPAPDLGQSEIERLAARQQLLQLIGNRTRMRKWSKRVQDGDVGRDALARPNVKARPQILHIRLRVGNRYDQCGFADQDESVRSASN